MARKKYLNDKIVSDAEFRESYAEWRILIKSTLKKFKYLLNEHDRLSCGQFALLRCIQRFNPERRVKFSTLLVNYVNWECKRMIGQKMKYKDMPASYLECIKIYSNETICADLLDSLPKLESEMLKEKYISGMTLKEMAVKYGVSQETIRKRLLKIKQKILEEEHECAAVNEQCDTV